MGDVTYFCAACKLAHLAAVWYVRTAPTGLTTYLCEKRFVTTSEPVARTRISSPPERTDLAATRSRRLAAPA